MSFLAFAQIERLCLMRIGTHELDDLMADAGDSSRLCVPQLEDHIVRSFDRPPQGQIDGYATPV